LHRVRYCVYKSHGVQNIMEDTYMRLTEMDQKLKEKPQQKVARVQTDNPTPISLNGFTLQIVELYND